MRDTFLRVEKGFTELFGNTTTGTLKKAITFIIKTETLITIISRIYLSWMLLCTNVWRTKKELKKTLRLIKNFSLLASRLQRFGTLHQKESLGTVSTQKNRLRGLKRFLVFVRYVVKNIRRTTLIDQNTATIIVKLRHVEEGMEYQKEVFDLTVEGSHQYIANGVVVHNCLDAVRYFAMMKLRKTSEFFVT